MLRIVIAAVLLLAALVPANASAGFSCVAENGGLSFVVEAAVGRSSGIMANFGGSLEGTTPAVPKALSRIDYQRSDLAGFWWQGRELLLDLYKEAEGEPYGHYESRLTVRTAATADEDGYRGRYAFEIGYADGDWKTTTIEGEVECSYE